jgi:CBS domain-containing protein
LTDLPMLRSRESEMLSIDRPHSIEFANQLKSARLAALGDAEAFGGIVHAIERLGSYLAKDKSKYGSLERYKEDLTSLSAKSGLAAPFERLYDVVKAARNDAFHQGAFARHLTKCAIELGLILEDALTNNSAPVVSDFMARNPVYAEPWQLIGSIRQQMLLNSYSYLPVVDEDGSWSIVSDADIVAFLGPDRNSPGRRLRLSMPLKTLIEAVAPLQTPQFVEEETGLERALECLKSSPVLLVRSRDPRRLLGILTAFDVL